MSRFPLRIAGWNGLVSPKSFISGEAPLSRRFLAIVTCSLSTATWSGVRLESSCKLKWTPAPALHNISTRPRLLDAVPTCSRESRVTDFGYTVTSAPRSSNSFTVPSSSAKNSIHADVRSQSRPPVPSFVVDGPGECLGRKCAYPYDLAYEQNREFLFLDKIHSVDRSQGSSIQPIFVRKSVYLAYFGRRVFDNHDSESAISNLPA